MAFSVRGLAARQLADYPAGTPGAFFAEEDHPRLSLDDAYAVQAKVASLRAAAHGVKAVDAGKAAKNAWAEAALTHPSWEAQASSALVAALVANRLDELRPEEALDASYALVEGRDEPGKRVRVTLRPLEGHEHNPGGWTVYTTRLALLGLLDAPGFRPGLEAVVRLGGGADTNGAVAGALLGARFGVGTIPSEWLRDVKGRESLLRLL